MTIDPAWHPDPSGRHQYRYWDGQTWTHHVATNGVASIEQHAAETSGQAVTSGQGTASTQSTLTPTGMNSQGSSTPISPATGDPEIDALQAADDSGDPEAAVLLGQALSRKGQTDLAREAYERGHRRGHPEAAMSLGSMLCDLGDLAGARSAYEQGIAAGSTMAALNLGLMLAEAGQVDDALRYLAVAREKTGDEDAHWAIGRLLEGKGDQTGAARSYRLGADAGSSRAAFDLGVLFYKLGDTEASRSAFERAEALGDSRAKELLEALEREPDAKRAPALARDLAAQCDKLMNLYYGCADKAKDVRKAEYVAAQPQGPASRQNFLGVAGRYRQEFVQNLDDLRAAQDIARATWNDLQHHTDTLGQSIDKALLPLLNSGALTMDDLNHIMVGGFGVKANFGTTVESFLEMDSKIMDAMELATNQ